MTVDFANPWAASGDWYKGNLHTHTTESDGRFTPEEVIRRYRKAGYHFLALSDHNKVTRVSRRASDGLLLLLATELDGDRADLGDTYHVLGFGLTNAADPPGRRPSKAGPAPRHPKVPQAIAWIKAHGGEAVIAHPYWSSLVVADLLRYDGYLGVEVFNTGCHYEIGKGYSSVHWDDVLARRRRLWAIAVDDSHHRASPSHPLDTARAWVMVKARALTRAAVMKSLRAGLFYSSWGPTIRDISVKDGVVTARTSPVTEINFVARGSSGGSAFAVKSPTITRASYRLAGGEGYLRVECRDAEGRWAWANPMFLR
jgi:predicted metal-dependent phosphoesterase TrpH